MPVTRQAVAKHLALLRDAGLVTAERAGRETRFTAATAPLDDLAAWAEAAGQRWDARLERLRRRLESRGCERGFLPRDRGLERRVPRQEV